MKGIRMSVDEEKVWRLLAAVLLVGIWGGGVAFGESPVLESDRVFAELMGEIRDIPSAERDYSELVRRCEEVCVRFPNSKAAMLCIKAGELWLEKGLVTTEQANRLVAYRDRFDPGKTEMVALVADYRKATAELDVQGARAVCERIEAVAEKYPGTLTRYNALANLPGMYVRCGDYDRARGASARYMAEYPPQKTDVYSSSTMEHANVFIDANLVVRTVGVDEGIGRFRQIADMYRGEAGYEVPALFSGGQLALDNDRLEMALELFSRLASSGSSPKKYV